MARFDAQPVNRKLVLAGHRGDGHTLVMPMAHKHGVDKVGGRERIFAHHAPQPFAHAHPARAQCGKNGSCQ